MISAKLQYKRLTPTAKLPKYMTEHAAGCDCYADVERRIHIFPGARKQVSLGFAVAVEPGFEMQLRPRSGMALKHGVTLVNTPGTIDADYRGEVSALLINHGEQPFLIDPGDRICQAVVSMVPQVEVSEVGELPQTVRGDGGFGHTGKNETATGE